MNKQGKQKYLNQNLVNDLISFLLDFHMSDSFSFIK